MQKISDKLKPAGFKKKGTRWIKALEDDFCLEFNAQKSQWSDEYYFNISIYRLKMIDSQCYASRVSIDKKALYDWQLITDKELNRLLDFAYESGCRLLSIRRLRRLAASAKYGRAVYAKEKNVKAVGCKGICGKLRAL